MKSILTVLGTFIFYLFSSGFSRLVISLYHNQSFQVTGYEQYPSEYWVVILIVSDTLFMWVSGMLTVTITGFAPLRHLTALAILLIFWRVNDIVYHASDSTLATQIALIGSVLIAIGMSYLIHRKTVVSALNDQDVSPE